LGIIALHPTFIILAGSINNDMLSILLLQASVFYAILWYRKPRTEAIIKLALAIGFGMMAKLSVGLIAPAVCFLFLYRFLTNLSARRKLAGQFAAFGAICMPVGLWWGIRNLIRFGVPITYVPALEETSHQYIGHYPVWVRLFDFSFYQLQSVYVAWGDPYFEHNIFIGLLKSSVFSEQTLSSVSSPFYRFAAVLFYINLIVVLLSLISMVYLLFRKFSAYHFPLKIFIGLIYLTFMAFYIQFCFAYPHTCTQNIRYITPAIWIGALAIGAASFLVRSDPSGSFRLRRNGGEV
jgi:hypothetical protein